MKPILDAIIFEVRGLVFPALIPVTGSQLRETALGFGAQSDGEEPSGYARLLSPGMSSTVEIKTGRQSVISYPLSPIARSVSEAGRER